MFVQKLTIRNPYIIIQEHQDGSRCHTGTFIASRGHTWSIKSNVSDAIKKASEKHFCFWFVLSSLVDNNRFKLCICLLQHIHQALAK